MTSTLTQWSPGDPLYPEPVEWWARQPIISLPAGEFSPARFQPTSSQDVTEILDTCLTCARKHGILRRCHE